MKCQSAKPAVVLVHGAFADASGWADVIRPLQKKGYDVTAVENPLSSYADDVATTKRVIDAQKGPVVVVAHSYGGAVMSGAAANNPNVKALVYVAAFAPDVGETLGPLLEKYPTKVGEAFRPDAAGFIYLDRATFHDTFAQDLPQEETDVMAATQKPLNGSVFEAKPTAAAWKEVPSWFIVAKERSRDQSRPRAHVRQADGCEDDGGGREPRRVHVPPGRRREGDRGSGGITTSTSLPC